MIDAIAYVENDKVPWLLFIQISLSAYANHKSKVEHLHSDVVGCEKTENTLNWLKYYCDLVPTGVQKDLQCMYIYISPQNFVDKDSVSKKEYDFTN